MCGRYTLTKLDNLLDDFDAALEPTTTQSEWWKPRFNIAPTQPAPVVTLDPQHGARVLELMRWGLVPFWAAKPGAKPPLMINARVESIDHKRVFRDALERKRCLVPADGFFEWRQTTKPATPLYFHPSPHRFIAFAGLWARLRTASGRELHSFTIITGPPNELVAPIHDRMPVILDRSAWASWLDPGLDAAGAHALLEIPPIGDVRAEAVSSWVNKADHDDATCIAPVPALFPP